MACYRLINVNHFSQKLSCKTGDIWGVSRGIPINKQIHIDPYLYIYISIYIYIYIKIDPLMLNTWNKPRWAKQRGPPRRWVRHPNDSRVKSPLTPQPRLIRKENEGKEENYNELDKIIWYGVCLKMVSTPKPNGWWSLSLLNGYNWEYTLFSDKPI